jgi:hypothetical protein
MSGDGDAFGIVRHVATVGFVRVEAGKTKERNRDIVRSGFPDSGKAEGSRRRRFIRDEIAQMRAAVFLNQTHPDARVMVKGFEFVSVNRVAYEAGNQSRIPPDQKNIKLQFEKPELSTNIHETALTEVFATKPPDGEG